MYSDNDLALAKKILHYSCDLNEGQNVLLQLTGLNGIGLIRALTKEAREVNAVPFVQIQDTETRRILMETGDADFWKKQADIDQQPLMKQMDAFVGIRASLNIYEHADVNKKANKAYGDHFVDPVHFKERVNNTNWVVLRYPSEAFAMNARMPTRKFRDFYYKACLLDYSKLSEAMKPLKRRLETTDKIQLKGEGTNIEFSVKGQTWVPCSGEKNIPDGELFSSPVIDSVNGHITYAPSVYQGKPFEYVKLEVTDGRVEDFDSSNNGALEEILGTDDGARRFGEFSFGLNPVISDPMYDILFDEKIYGSNHLTLGNDYEEAPNGNESNIHWDLVCIGADVFLDGEKIREGRQFIADDLKQLNPENLV